MNVHYTDKDIANAYNLLFELKDKPFTTRKAMKMFDGRYEAEMLEELKQSGLLLYNETDEDWQFPVHILDEGRKGALWVIDYYLKECDPQLLEAAELWVIKGKSDLDYIQEKLDLSDERIERIKNELIALGILEQRFNELRSRHRFFEGSVKEYIIFNCYRLFCEKLKVL